MDPIDLAAWKQLVILHQESDLCLHKLFSDDPNRFSKYSIHIKESKVDLFVDYSKNLVDDRVMHELWNLFKEAKVSELRDQMFRGQPINCTDNRPVLHMALRSPGPFMDGKNQDLAPLVQKELDKMKQLCSKLDCGELKGYGGQKISNIVNIGIGGSDLGPRMVCSALEPFAIDSNRLVKTHFVSNIDGYDLERILDQCDPESTMFIIVSKTFTTLETMENAKSAKSWILNHFKHQEAVSHHFVAVSTNLERILEFGIPNDELHIFGFWDWVGGRYSLWSVVGLSICLYIGWDNFNDLLHGAHVVDQHFLNAPVERNVPVILALVGIWYNNFCRAESHAVLPYEQALELFPKYLQQLDMESNGKSVTRAGKLIQDRWQTGPIVWGESGTNGQHAFYQLIHQGTKLIPCDFIGGFVPTRTRSNAVDRDRHHQLLISNMIAQTEALMRGSQAEAPPHRFFRGNKPTTSIFYSTLTPANLGALIAVYEHKIMVQGAIWNINSYDQWGVELGKVLANSITEELDKNVIEPTHDPSTRSLLNMYRERR